MAEYLEQFRTDVRDWLDKHCPPEMQSPTASDAELPWGGKQFAWSPVQRQWRDAMISRGWTAPSWPKEYGGGDLTPDEQQILTEEMRRISARPAVFSYGLSMLGPVLLKYGTEEQKQRHLAPIARGEIRWCQGYSEPGAGSDLASLKTRAEDHGDFYRVQGQKIWTSYADKSDWIFCLVRTDFAAPKHKGISFLLIDMSSTGITVKPIKLISGASRFCEVFFDDVRVPKENLVGAPGTGWTIAKSLMEHERGAIAGHRLNDGVEPLSQVAMKLIGPDHDGRLCDTVLRAEIARFEIDEAAFQILVSQSHAASELASVTKYYGTELNKRREDLLMLLRGSDSLKWAGPGAEKTRNWLYSRALSILGGTNEIQLNVIAKRTLGLG